MGDKQHKDQNKGEKANKGLIFLSEASFTSWLY